MKRNHSCLFAVCVLAAALTACSTPAKKAETTSETKIESSMETAQTESVSESAEPVGDGGTHFVTDYTGSMIEVPDQITRVVIDQIPILSTYMAYFNGSAPYIVGYCGSFKQVISDTALKNIAPELMESSDTVYAQSDLNMEEIMKLDPDVILYNAGNTAHAEILKASGIPCIGFPTVGHETPADPLKRYDQWLRLLEDVFGEPGKMDEFISAGQEIVDSVESRIAEIPKEDRPSALQLFKIIDGNVQVSGKGVFSDYWFQHLGVQNVAAEDAAGFAQINVEQMYDWDPDIIFDNGPGLIDVRPSDILANNVEGIDFSVMKAVQTGRVYDTTLGMWNWTTPNPDGPLVLAWLACKTYPEQFADYPLADTIRDYYKQWYGYDVTDDELEGMLNN